MDKKRLVNWFVFIFPIIALWVLAWLHMNIRFYDGYCYQDFFFSGYGFAYWLSMIIIEIGLVINYSD